jgi:hypothetical protein
VLAVAATLAVSLSDQFPGLLWSALLRHHPARYVYTGEAVPAALFAGWAAAALLLGSALRAPLLVAAAIGAGLAGAELWWGGGAAPIHQAAVVAGLATGTVMARRVGDGGWCGWAGVVVRALAGMAGAAAGATLVVLRFDDALARHLQARVAVELAIHLDTGLVMRAGHFVVWMVLATLVVASVRSARARLAVGAALLASGVTVEVLQGIVTDRRHPDLIDAMATSAGVVAGLALGWRIASVTAAAGSEELEGAEAEPQVLDLRDLGQGQRPPRQDGTGPGKREQPADRPI